jgi:hypothetical protein
MSPVEQGKDIIGYLMPDSNSHTALRRALYITAVGHLNI